MTTAAEFVKTTDTNKHSMKLTELFIVLLQIFSKFKNSIFRKCIAKVDVLFAVQKHH